MNEENKELRKLCKEFLDSLTDVQFLTFTLHYGFNPRSINLSVYEISKALNCAPSVIYGSIQLIVNRLNLRKYQPLRDSLSLSRESHE